MLEVSSLRLIKCPLQTVKIYVYHTCDRIWENPYGIHAWFMMCAFLVARVEICQSPDFVIHMSNNPSSNCCRRLWRLVVLYKGEISLHFDPPSWHSCRTRSPLLWVLIRIPASGLSRYSEIYRTTVSLSSWGIEEQSAVVLDENRPLLNLYIHFEWPRPGPFN